MLGVWMVASLAALAQDTRTPPLGPIAISSPDRSFVVVVAGTGQASAASWRYRLDRRAADGKTEFLGWSPLGLVRDDEDFTKLHLKGVSPVRAVSERYTVPHGKRRTTKTTASQRVLHFLSPGGKPLDVVVRVSNDGLAFRYQFPDRSDRQHTLKEEFTGFTVASGARGWLLPHQQVGKWAPAYEDFFSEVDAGTTSPSPAGWSYPALFRLADARHWILITEAGLERTYCGTRLRADAPSGTYRIRFPDPDRGPRHRRGRAFVDAAMVDALARGDRRRRPRAYRRVDARVGPQRTHDDRGSDVDSPWPRVVRLVERR